MTEASTGLRKALARKAGVSQLSTEELLAQLSDDQKAGLAAALNPAASAGDKPKKASDDEDDDDMDPEGDGKKPKSKNKDDEYMDDKASAAKAATDRSLAVMASEHFAGREKLAANLLGSSMSADEIVTALAAAPKGAAPANDEADADAKARADMRAKLAAEQPGNLGGADDAPESGAVTNWSDIHAEVAKDRGYAAN